MAITLNGTTGITTPDITSTAGFDSADLTGDIAAARITTALNATGSAPIYACRAWVNFSDTGTVAINSSGNVSSITDNGTGDYTVNFTVAMPDANYAVSGTNAFSGVGSSVYAIKPRSSGDFATSSIRILSVYASSGTTDVWDANSITVAVFR